MSMKRYFFINLLLSMRSYVNSLYRRLEFLRENRWGLTSVLSCFLFLLDFLNFFFQGFELGKNFVQSLVLFFFYFAHLLCGFIILKSRDQNHLVNIGTSHKDVTVKSFCCEIETTILNQFFFVEKEIINSILIPIDRVFSSTAFLILIKAAVPTASPLLSTLG